MRAIRAGLLVAVAVMLAGAARAEESTGATLADACARLTARYQAAVLLDPALQPSAALPSLETEASLEKALNALTARVRDAAWRRVYLPKGSPREARRVAAAARTLGAMPDTSLAVLRPDDRETIRYERRAATAPEAADAAAQAGLDPQPLYVVYSTTATDDGRSAEEQFADLQSRQLALMARLRPDQLANPFADTVKLLQGMTPDAFQQFAGRTLDAGMRVWDSLPPEQRQSIIAGSVQAGETLGNRPGNAAPAAPPRNHRVEMAAAAAALAKRCDARVLVDPSAWVPERPAALDPKLDAEPALRKLIDGQAGLLWTRAYLREGSKPGAQVLAEEVRALAPWMRARVVVEDPGRAWVSTLRPEAAPVHPDNAIFAGLEKKPVYVIYSADTGAKSGTPPEEQYAKLQRAQIQAMVRMTPDQLAGAMQSAVEMWQTGSAAQRGRVMALPVVAGMMAVWMPRAAKERTAMP